MSYSWPVSGFLWLSFLSPGDNFWLVISMQYIFSFKLFFLNTFCRLAYFSLSVNCSLQENGCVKTREVMQEWEKVYECWFLEVVIHLTHEFRFSIFFTHYVHLKSANKHETRRGLWVSFLPLLIFLFLYFFIRLHMSSV